MTGKQLLEKARVSVFHNGLCVQNNQEINGPTDIEGDRPLDKPGPIYLQDHGHPVQYRNIWVTPLPEEAPTSTNPMRYEHYLLDAVRRTSMQ